MSDDRRSEEFSSEKAKSNAVADVHIFNYKLQVQLYLKVNLYTDRKKILIEKYQMKKCAITLFFVLIVQLKMKAVYLFLKICKCASAV